MFCGFANLFNFGSTKGRALCPLLRSGSGDVLLWWKHVKSIRPHPEAHHCRRGRVLLVFSDNGGYLFLICFAITTKLDKCYFSKSLHVESDTVSVKRLCVIIINTTGVPRILNGSFTRACSGITVLASLGK